MTTQHAPSNTAIHALNEKQAAATVGVSVALLRKHRAKGIGCPYVKIGRRVVHRLEDINDFMASRTVGGVQ